jgi:hypothetical protein
MVFYFIEVGDILVHNAPAHHSEPGVSLQLGSIPDLKLAGGRGTIPLALFPATRFLETLYCRLQAHNFRYHHFVIISTL